MVTLMFEAGALLSCGHHLESCLHDVRTTSQHFTDVAVQPFTDAESISEGILVILMWRSRYKRALEAFWWYEMIVVSGYVLFTRNSERYLYANPGASSSRSIKQY